MFLGLFFPHYCPVCGTTTEVERVCLDCEPKLFSIVHSTVPNSLTPLLACGSYTRPGWRVTIHAGKFMGEQELFTYITQRMSSRSEVRTYVKDSLLVPIPLHPKRIRERGYNQAEIIAHTLSQELHIPAAQMLERIGSAHPQSRRRRKDKNNADFTFRVLRSRLPRSTRITLIDDVCTSGTTLRLAISALNASGYTHIQAFTFCTG